MLIVPIPKILQINTLKLFNSVFIKANHYDRNRSRFMNLNFLTKKN